MEWIHWALLLALAGLVVAVLEVFIPSAGVLTILAGIMFLAAIFIVAMQYGPAAGFACLAVALVVLPVIAFFLLRWWPNSPMGRRILGTLPTDDDVRPDSPQDRMLRDLLGKVGVAKSLMLPSGAAVICGRTVNALSEGLPIEAGDHVMVVEVRGNRVVVRKTEEPVDEIADRRQPAPSAAETERAHTAAEEPQEKRDEKQLRQQQPAEKPPAEPAPDDQLSRSIDELGLEPLDDLSESK